MVIYPTLLFFFLQSPIGNIAVIVLHGANKAKLSIEPDSAY